jgi:hypothetical protein
MRIGGMVFVVIIENTIDAVYLSRALAWERADQIGGYVEIAPLNEEEIG